MPTGEGSSFVSTAAESSGKVGADIGLTVRKHGHEKSSYEKVEHENQHGRSDHGLRRGPTHALGSPARIHAVEAAYGRDNETKQNRLHQSHKHVLKNQRLPCVRPILPGVQMEQHLGDQTSASQAHQI